MDYQLVNRREQDIGRGTALLISGAVMVLLTWILPLIAPLAVAAYGLYQLYHKHIGEGLVGLALAVLLWFLRLPVRWLLWLVGAVMVGIGVFLLIRGLRSQAIFD
jgi:4-amino-4-deoxy-L-arabinose transferase-like glycosyltransferase